MKARLKVADPDEKQLDFVEASQEFLKRANKIGTYAATMKDAVGNVAILRKKIGSLRITYSGTGLKLDPEDQKALNSAILTYFLEKAQAAHIKLLQAKDAL